MLSTSLTRRHQVGKSLALNRPSSPAPQVTSPAPWERLSGRKRMSSLVVSNLKQRALASHQPDRTNDQASKFSRGRRPQTLVEVPIIPAIRRANSRWKARGRRLPRIPFARPFEAAVARSAIFWQARRGWRGRKGSTRAGHCRLRYRCWREQGPAVAGEPSGSSS